ncbi:aminoglycoside phosphotransferase [Rhodopirellula sp. SM50]|nr:phosphotransferase [Rhodopirellula sp. SM50]PAY21236.1 aminoglycoside phosphotransferase [Rhodopirellula sp. SM50]
MDHDQPQPGPIHFDPISKNDPASVATSLGRNGWMRDDEILVGVESAGEGNMNCTLRATLRDPAGRERTLIVKQSRPWVEKYPTIAAPVERAWSEARFYECVGSVAEVAAQMPTLVGKDTANYTLCLTDLSGSVDMTDAYGQASLPLDAAARWLGQLHSIELQPDQCASFQNVELRKLNHQHIFEIPLQSQLPIDLEQITTGLETTRRQVIADGNLLAIAKQMGDVYVDADSWNDPNARLLHGDYYPGSFLRSPAANPTDAPSFFVIDPEFCFVGPPEFDLGVLLAHTLFCGIDCGEAKEQISAAYRGDRFIRHDLWQRFAGFEILRRLLGVAQLPLTATLQTKHQWIDIAREWIR